MPPRSIPLMPLVRFAAICIGLVVLFVVLPFRDDRWWIAALVGSAAIAATVPFTVRRVRMIRTAERPMIAAMEAVVVLLLMVVLGFSAVYLTIDRGAGQFDGMATRVDAIYFTVTTLSTVGFGDIVAAGQAARVAVTLQILLDLSLIAVAFRALAAAARSRVSP